mmetsp:Transcript_6821/g.25462  ORF Transcript_6821/g.25462 Transcript_6821/m.25462 type:complete len:261 (+) Transcript_6821:263-1045(+)
MTPLHTTASSMRQPITQPSTQQTIPPPPPSIIHNPRMHPPPPPSPGHASSTGGCQQPPPHHHCPGKGSTSPQCGSDQGNPHSPLLSTTLCWTRPRTSPATWTCQSIAQHAPPLPLTLTPLPLTAQPSEQSASSQHPPQSTRNSSHAPLETPCHKCSSCPSTCPWNKRLPGCPRRTPPLSPSTHPQQSPNLSHAIQQTCHFGSITCTCRIASCHTPPPQTICPQQCARWPSLKMLSNTIPQIANLHRSTCISSSICWTEST